ncbi:MAG: Asp23/Gls24 family envelope stress response protein [Bacilli bacterium]|nr:Asp23/Gls24 family envelope stress response protein [Bacilli bacterium]
MSDFYELNNYKKIGKMNISRRVFENIALITANHISNPEKEGGKSKKKIFRLSNPVQVYLRKGGKVDIHLDLTLKKGCNVAKVTEQVQEEVASSIQNMCEAVPFKVKIRVSAIR